jgi:hypothetical protein
MLVKRILSAAAGVVAVVGAASPAVAGQGAGLEGSFDGRTYTTCTQDGEPYTPPGGTVTGSWRVNLHDTKATARFVIYVDGALHVAYTTQLTRTDGDSSVFTATTTTAAGPLEVKLVGDHLSYTIEPYTDPFGGGFSCDSVVYTGTTG